MPEILTGLLSLFTLERISTFLQHRRDVSSMAALRPQKFLWLLNTEEQFSGLMSSQVRENIGERFLGAYYPK